MATTLVVGRFLVDIVIILGAPGSGKGTQSAMIMQDYDLKPLVVGNILREAIANETEVGLFAKSYMDKGDLVPDEVIIGLIGEALISGEFSGGRGVLLDGFPRNTVQATAFDAMLHTKLSTSLSCIIALDTPEELLMERMVGRLYCTECGATYHTTYKKPKQGNTCDLDGSNLIQRDDDKLEVITKRLEVYKQQTMVLTSYYSSVPCYRNIPATGTPEEVYKSIRQALDSCLS